MDDELRAILSEWVQQTRQASEAQIEANKLVCKIWETLAVKDMIQKIQETNSGNQLFLN
jgi:hypothetical protein